MSKTVSWIVAAAGITAAVSGCERAPSVEEIRQVPYESTVVAAHMTDHFYRMSELQRALINGDLAATKDPAAWLADHPTSAAVPEAWTELLVPFRSAANRVVEARDIQAAATATAQAAGACGSCHEMLGADIGFPVEAAPVEGSDVIPHMQRHAWASGRMWEGLLGPSALVWQEGARLLGEAPLAPAQLDAPIEVLSEVSELERRVHALGAQAVEADDQDNRAEIYGRLLGTCARCHRLTGVGSI